MSIASGVPFPLLLPLETSLPLSRDDSHLSYLSRLAEVPLGGVAALEELDEAAEGGPVVGST